VISYISHDVRLVRSEVPGTNFMVVLSYCSLSVGA
jgi:hypothetical protein